MPFINFSELYNSGGSFSMQEVNVDGGTTIIYGGYAPLPEPGRTTEATGGWLIRRLEVTEDGDNHQLIQCTWARGPWSERANLEYKYQLPRTPGMYSEPQPPLDPNPPV